MKVTHAWQQSPWRARVWSTPKACQHLQNMSKLRIIPRINCTSGSSTPSSLTWPSTHALSSLRWRSDAGSCWGNLEKPGKGVMKPGTVTVIDLLGIAGGGGASVTRHCRPLTSCICQYLSSHMFAYHFIGVVCMPICYL